MFGVFDEKVYFCVMATFCRQRHYASQSNYYVINHFIARL